MKVGDYVSYDALGLADLVRKRDISVEEVAQAALKAVEAVNPQIGAVVESWDDEALAAEATSPFAGVPFLIKDVGIAMAGRRSEAGSRLAAGSVPPINSLLVSRFRAAGDERRDDGAGDAGDVRLRTQPERLRSPGGHRRSKHSHPVARSLLRRVRPISSRRLSPTSRRRSGHTTPGTRRSTASVGSDACSIMLRSPRRPTSPAYRPCRCL